MINQQMTDLTITTTKILGFLNLKRELLCTLEVSLKLVHREVNDPEKIENRNKAKNKRRKMYLVCKVKVRNDEKTKFPHRLPMCKCNRNHNKKKERMYPSSMLSQKYLPPSSDLIELMID